MRAVTIDDSVKTDLPYHVFMYITNAEILWPIINNDARVTIAQEIENMIQQLENKPASKQANLLNERYQKLLSIHQNQGV